MYFNHSRHLHQFYISYTTEYFLSFSDDVVEQRKLGIKKQKPKASIESIYLSSASQDFCQGTVPDQFQCHLLTHTQARDLESPLVSFLI